MAMVFYRFWAHYLRQRFNPDIYCDFRKSAMTDLARRPPILFGAQQLVSFYKAVISDCRSLPGVNLRHELQEASRLLSEVSSGRAP